MANKAIQAILTRVSCREYNEKKVSLGKLNQILEAGKYAPSGKFRQIANITCVRTKAKVERLRELLKEQFGRECLYGANTVVLVHGPRDDAFTVQDCSCVLENIFVAANALKVQSCWINQFDELFSTPKGMKMKERLGIPAENRVVGAAILGYAKDPSKLVVKQRKADIISIK